ncbi:type II toxin-antitoxin system RelE/ParE family toxin [Flagellimonas sp.]|uniref:type II toxin-antitoxin system RelE/ParE family toxin n=1 Tax=Flagellimonas sp. TaxID=2058762 RepID=UPI003B5014FD
MDLNQNGTRRFETILLEEAFVFIKKQNIKTRKKILQNIRRAEQHNDPRFFKKLTGEIWEFRTLYSGVQYRLLAFWDKEDKTNTLILATHGIVKKTSKVDKREIEKAESIRRSYFKNRVK